MDTISNLLTSIRNAEMAGLRSLSVPLSKISKSILQILKDNHYIQSFKEEESKLIIDLHLERHHYKRISKPGRRLYTKAEKIPRILGGAGMVIISTPEGVLSGKEARKRGLGGEIICEVY